MADTTTVYCNRWCYFLDPSGRVVDSENFREYELEPGKSYTPGHANHVPHNDADWERYEDCELDSIWYDGEDYTNDVITCPNKNFTCEYYYNLLCPPEWDWDSNVSPKATMPRVTKISDTEYEVRPLTANEWNNFIRHMRWASWYRGDRFDGDISSVFVTRGSEMKVADITNGHLILEALQPDDPMPDLPAKNSDIRASYFIDLKKALNSIIKSL